MKRLGRLRHNDAVVTPFDRERRRRRDHAGGVVLLALGVVIGFSLGRLLCALGF